MIVKETLILNKIDLKGMYGLQRVRGSIPFPSFGHFWTISRNQSSKVEISIENGKGTDDCPTAIICSLFEGVIMLYGILYPIFRTLTDF